MRAILVAALVLSVTLAGCGGKGHDLDPYLVKSGEAPDACYHVETSDEDWEFVFRALGIDSNPGSIDQEVIDNASKENAFPSVPVQNRLAIFECRFEEGESTFASAAVKFASKEDADYWLEQDDALEFFGGECSQRAKAFRTDTIVGTMASADADGWHAAELAAVEKALARIEDRGAEALC